MAYGLSDAELPPYLVRTNELLAAKGLTPYTASDLHGEMNQLKALIDICHAYGIAVIFDLVFNHAGGEFGDQTIWFFDRQAGAEEPRWWNSLYFSDRTWAGGVVFNFQSDPVRAFLIENAKFYLDEYRVDGFRFDEVSVIDHQGYGPRLGLLPGAHRNPATTPSRSLGSRRVLERQSVDRKRTRRLKWSRISHYDDGRTPDRDPAGLEAASVPGNHALPLSQVAEQLALDYLRNRWRGRESAWRTRPRAESRKIRTIATEWRESHGLPIHQTRAHGMRPVVLE
jgi:hypothetical protein